jgi:hypothetical protein
MANVPAPPTRPQYAQYAQVEPVARPPAPAGPLELFGLTLAPQPAQRRCLDVLVDPLVDLAWEDAFAGHFHQYADRY